MKGYRQARTLWKWKCQCHINGARQTLILSCLQLSSIRGLAALWTVCLHCRRSSNCHTLFLGSAWSMMLYFWSKTSWVFLFFSFSVIYIDLFLPAVSTFRMTCLKYRYFNFPVLTSSNKLFWTPAFSSTQSFVFLTVHVTVSRPIWRNPLISATSIRLSSDLLIVQFLHSFHKLIPTTPAFSVVIFLLQLICCDCVRPLPVPHWLHDLCIVLVEFLLHTTNIGSIICPSIHAIFNTLEGHSPAARLFKCNSTNICATFRTVSTDTARRAVPRRQLSFLFFCPLALS